MKKIKFIIASFIVLILTSSVLVLLRNNPSLAANGNNGTVNDKDNFTDALYNGEHMNTPAKDLVGTTFPGGHMGGDKYGDMQSAECRRGVCLNHNQGDAGTQPNRFSIIESIIEVNSDGEVMVYSSDGSSIAVTGPDAEVFNTMACLAEQHTQRYEDKMNGEYADESDGSTYGYQHPGSFLANHREVTDGKWGFNISDFNVLDGITAYDESKVNSRNRIAPGKTMRFYIMTDWKIEADGSLTQISQGRMWWEDNGGQPRTFTKLGDGGNPLEDFKFFWQERSIREEYEDDYPDFFNPQADIYQDPVGDVDFFVSDGHCEITLTPDDALVPTRTEQRYEITKRIPKTRQVQSGTDSNGNPTYRTESYTEYEYGWVTHTVEWKCTTHGDVFGDKSHLLLDSPCSCPEGEAHVNAYNTKKASTDALLMEKMEKFHAAREKGVAEVNGHPYTDKEGKIDITPLCPTGDDYLGLIDEKEITVNWNPYYNNDHPNLENICYWEDVTWIDKRRRMDIEGYIWEDIPAAGKNGTNREDTDGVYGGGDRLLAPVSVELKLGGSTIGSGVVTANGMYRIRVGGYDGADLDKMMANKGACYLEFTYNGLKYQSVYPAYPSGESIALESVSDRTAFNQKFTTIVSNNRDMNSNNAPTKDVTVMFNQSGQYSKKVNYEGNVLNFSGEAADPIGDAQYSIGYKVPKATEVDKVTPTEQEKPHKYDRSPCADDCYTFTSKTPTNSTKYQIAATTKETPWKGILNYSLYDDKIEGANFGVYEREQPDISIVNDIERVLLKMNGEYYIYQYGEKTQNSGDVENMLDDEEAEKAFGKSAATVKFESNVHYTNKDSDKRYRREIHGEHVKIKQEEQNNRKDEADPFQITVYYKTTVKNDSTNLTMGNIELVTHYDNQYDKGSVADRSSEFNDTDATVTWGTSKYKTGNGSAPTNYWNSIGTINCDPLKPNEEVTIYTSYTASRETFLALVDSKNKDHVFVNNNIEVNAYTTTYPETERTETGPAFAGVDKDSAAGNSDPNNKEATYEDDNDEAPTLEIYMSEVRKISGNVFEDVIENKAVPDETRKSLQSYLGDGENNNEKGIKDVKVELVELDNKGEEILDGGKTKVQLFNWHDGGKPKLAETKTDEDGNYSFVGFIPGEYIVKFTWGQQVAYADSGTGEPLTSTIKNGDITYVQQYKGTKYVDQARYEDSIALKTENETKDEWYVDGDGTKNRWYLDESYKKKSNAIDDMETRRLIDDQTENIGHDHKYQGEFYRPRVSKDNTKDAEGNTLVLPDIINEEYIKANNLITSLTSRTPAFDVGVEEVGTSGNPVNEEPRGQKSLGSTYDPLNIENLDFGICKRPETDMILEKRIERIKVTLANGTVVIDGTVDWNEEGTEADLKGNVQNASYPKPQKTTDRTDTGNFKIEMDQEILQGATLEATYRFTVKNNSYLDYDVVSEDTVNAYHLTPEINKYYKYGDTSSGTPEESEVTISATKIIDYLDNKMGYIRKPEENAPSENDLWEEITQEENSRNNIITDLLYDGRFEKEKAEDPKGIGNQAYENGDYNKYSEKIIKTTEEGEVYGESNIQEQLKNYIYKAYRTILRDLTSENVEKLTDNGYTVEDSDYIILKAQEKYEDLKFVASKQLSATNTDLSYYNVVELAQLRKTSGAIPEKIMVGNNDATSTGSYSTLGSSPNWKSEYDYSITPEHDGDYASVITIVPPTGDNKNFTAIAWTILGVSSLGILGAGIVLIKKLVLNSKKI